MRHMFSIALALLASHALAAPALAADAPSVSSTRVGAFDFQAQRSNGETSNHTRPDIAVIACANWLFTNPTGTCDVQGGKWRVVATMPAAPPPVDPPPPPPPAAVDCAVSAWTETPGAWSACSGGQQTRTVVLNRTITTQPANGGAACPSLTGSRTDTQPCTVDPPPPTGGAPFPLYPALDLNTIPWHTAAGAWGPRVAIQAPALPTTTRQVSVSSASQFNQAAAVAGTQITITSGWSPTTNASISASDIDVIIPRGVTIGSVQLGNWPYTTPVQRVRIRGPVVGQHSGGLMGQYRDFELATDIVLDGIDINGAAGFSGGRGGEDNQAFRPSGTRMAVLNSRVIAPGYTWLGSAKHVVIANSNFYHGAASRSSVGFAEGWGIRNTGGPITIVDSRIQGTRYHNLRAQSVGGSGELLYVTRSTFVAQAEGRTGWLWNNLNQTSSNGQGAVFENNDVYTYSAPGCGLGTELDTSNADYWAIRNNRFFGAGNAVFGGNASGWTGNTFGSWTNPDVPWRGPGDPRQVPLPPGFTLISGEGSCPGY